MSLIKDTIILAIIEKDLGLDIELKEFEESEHPRWPEGESGGKGGQFAPKNSGSRSSKPEFPKNPHEAIFDNLSKTSPLNPKNFRGTHNKIISKEISTKKGKIAITVASLFYSLVESKDHLKKLTSLLKKFDNPVQAEKLLNLVITDSHFHKLQEWIVQKILPKEEAVKAYNVYLKDVVKATTDTQSQYKMMLGSNETKFKIFSDMVNAFKNVKNINTPKIEMRTFPNGEQQFLGHYDSLNNKIEIFLNGETRLSNTLMHEMSHAQTHKNPEIYNRHFGNYIRALEKLDGNIIHHSPRHIYKLELVNRDPDELLAFPPLFILHPMKKLKSGELKLMKGKELDKFQKDYLEPGSSRMIRDIDSLMAMETNPYFKFESPITDHGGPHNFKDLYRLKNIEEFCAVHVERGGTL